MKRIHCWRVWLVSFISCALRLAGDPVQLGFTFQGVLEDGGLPADGTYDLAFTVFNDPVAGSALADRMVVDNVAVVGGIFSVELNFQPSAFSGIQLWLEIEVRPGASVDPADFSELGPRQKVTAVPHALYSVAAGTVRSGTGVRTASSLSPSQLASLGRVNFDYRFAAPPVVTVTGIYDPQAPAFFLPQVANVDNDGFDLVVYVHGGQVSNQRPYAFNWVAVGDGNLVRNWYRDFDGDLYSDGQVLESYNQPAGYYPGSALKLTYGDCDDTDPTVHPGATEIWYDGIDQDCDGRSDFDQDMDAYDSSAYGGDDCDDTDRWIHPGAMELCNGIDDDCDGLVDADCQSRSCSDEMTELFFNTYMACRNAGDAPEQCFTLAVAAVDNQACEDAFFYLSFECPSELCVFGTPSDLAKCLYFGCGGGGFYYQIFGDPVDADGDGYHEFIDCDDGDPAVNPAASEIWYDGVDQNCDGHSDFDQDLDGYDSAAYGGTDCDDTDPTIHPYAFDTCADGVDQDCNGVDRQCEDLDMDGYDESVDCDDLDPAINPGAIEVWYDGVDQNCDGHSDFDQDFDGYEAQFAGGTDCDDTDPNIHPGAPEIWYDGINQNCDSLSDYDQDDDGFDSSAHSGTDCEDTNPDIHPGAADIGGDGIDQNCDGSDTAADAFLQVSDLQHGDLIITEIMWYSFQFPFGQWFEIYNNSGRTIDLRRLLISTPWAYHTIPSTIPLQAGAYFVIGASSDPLSNDGAVVNYSLGMEIILDTEYGMIELYDASDFSLVDFVQYAPWASFPSAYPGHSLSLDPGYLNPGLNDDGSFWCQGSDSFGTGSFGTPGAPNPSCYP